jgi:hypothetical protein
MANFILQLIVTMQEKRQHPLEKYTKAFIKFTDAGEDEFSISYNYEVLAHYEQKTYIISHYDDLLSEFKTYFSTDYTLIYTEIPFGLWEILFEKHNEITKEDLIIDIYNAWKIYWEREISVYNNEVIHELKATSWEEFQVLIEKIQSGPNNFIQNATNISDITLIPIIALALRSQFKNEDEFYNECMHIFIEEFPDHFGDDGNFDQINLDPNSSDINDAFYIYEISS